jgi:hypothetical protein
LDSPYSDITANDKQKYLCDNGFDVFKWPKEIGKKFKDINELCVRYKYNEFPYKFIIKNTYRNDFSSKIEELLNR